jgi:hypothetical protein
MSNTALAWTNYVKTGVVTANNAAANFPVTNLQTDSGAPAEGWQTNAGALTNATLTITPATGAQTWRALGLFRTNLTAGATLIFSLKNNPSTVVYTTTVAGPVGATGQVVVVVPSNTVADYATIQITDTANPDNHINIPLAFGGPVWLPTSPAALDTAYGRDSQVDTPVSRSGQEYPVLRWQRRRWDISWVGIRASTELWPQLDTMNRLAMAGGNVLLVPDITSANLRYEALFGRLAQLADVTFPLGTSDRRAWKGRLTERL